MTRQNGCALNRRTGSSQTIDLRDYVTGIGNDVVISIVSRTNLVKHSVSD